MLRDYFHPFKLNLWPKPQEPEVVKLHAPAHDTMEGAEFMDDALRFEDELPMMKTEVSVASGSPEKLL
ncbi:hypothetical protein A4D02_05460 [Niastella koreensis]|uniref:Uncharacterized protein n=2 Tax=Niastella koreensis TaxID=354356 RepID=G8TCD1_NIAKG|nr:hypothetical protein [Niastella koreensis]AEW01438.1 hypothetical protein Niako_5201 [Niastella koreensis GR20-10]OQP48168.1 hypothetical protein A4D02_05460 [Niastella koreensis]